MRIWIIMLGLAAALFGTGCRTVYNENTATEVKTLQQTPVVAADGEMKP